MDPVNREIDTKKPAGHKDAPQVVPRDTVPRLIHTKVSLQFITMSIYR